jgi:hypothetical protein
MNQLKSLVKNIGRQAGMNTSKLKKVSEFLMNFVALSLSSFNLSKPSKFWEKFMSVVFFKN